MMRFTLGFGTPAGRRRWRRGVGGSLLAAVVLVAAAPYLLSWPPLANLALRGASLRIHGRATVGAASLGWFSHPALADFEVQPHDGPPLVKAPSIEVDRPLWQIVTHRDVGEVRIEHARLHLLLRADGSNLEDLLGRRLKPEKPSGQAPAQGERQNRLPTPRIARSVDVRLVDLNVAWQTPASKQQWNIEGINLAFGLRPASATASGSPELLVERGRVIDHCQISRGMCNDFLDLAAPILSKATHAQGEFSIDLDDWQVPLDHPETGRLGGKLSLHKVVVEPGSFAHQLAEKLRVAPAVELARESVVTFELVDGRVHHRDLEFRLPPLRVRTSGSVGFDESLEMLAEIRVVLPEGIASALPSARELTEKTLRIPITGTLAKPRIDVSAMGDTDLARAIDKLQALGVRLAKRKHRPTVGQPGQAEGRQGAADEAEGDEASDSLLPPAAVDVLEDLAKKWSQRRKKDTVNDDAADDDQPPAEETPIESAGKRALDRVLDRVRKLKK